ncbi:MAG: lipopolysaccharide biosynthesis protein [Nitrosomonadales bacterium]|nr:lipopolysaccharide biosynthesis protein [Nitrosomonadales bacterium]
MAADYQLTPQDYLSIARRRALYLIGTFVVVFLGAVVIAVTMPPTYRSTGTIMVESQQVPDNIVPSAIKSQFDERINSIRQRVLTRESLLRIASKYGLFKDGSGSRTTAELVDGMRNRIGIELVNVEAVQNYRLGKATIAFKLFFEDRHSDIAYNVTRDLVALFLDWNVKLRTESAAEAALFLTQESDKLKTEVDRLEGVIAAYKRQNSSSLPEQETLRANMLARAENDLHEVERDIRSAKDALRSLEAELSAAKSSAGELPADELQRLKAEHAKLSAIYTESHPDLRALKLKITALEQKTNVAEAQSAPASPPNLAVYLAQSKVDSAYARLESLEQQKKILQAKIIQNEHVMEQTPRVKQGLDILLRDRDSAQKKYEEIYNKKMNAKIAENLESENKAERFTLLEPPLVPEKPVKPDRIKIIVMGFFLAIASSGGTLLLMATVDQRIRGADALAYVLGQPPLAVIPYLVIQEEEVRKRRLLKLSVAVFAGSVIAAAAAIHFFYMPLDIVLSKIQARLS